MTRLLAPFAAAALLLALLLPGLGSSGLLDPWEMDRAATARRLAGTPQALVVDDKGALLRQLEAADLAVALRRVDAAGAPQSLRVAVREMGERMTHALVVDLDAVVRSAASKPQAGAWDAAAAQLDKVADENRGALVLLVSDKLSAAEVQSALASARARLARNSFRGTWSRHLFPAADASALGPLFAGTEQVSTLAAAADTLRARLPSTWTHVQHKVDRRSVQAPLLDTWLVAASLSAFGPSETAARLPGALLAALTALLLFVAMRALWGDAAAWLAVAVYATLPLAMGNARLVTLGQTAPLGVALVTFGLALGVAERSRLWWLWLVAGLDMLLLGRGLGGLTMGAGICVAYLLVTLDLRRAPVVAAALAALTLAVAATVVLSDDTSPLLRSLRFTQVPFGGGVPDDKREFSSVVGMLGFGLYPWGALFLLGMGRLLTRGFGEGAKADATPSAALAPLEGARVALGLGFGAPLLVGLVLLPEFHHWTVPVAAIVAAVTATVLVDVREGRLGGGVHGAALALLIVVPTLLLHREIGKEASTLVRWLTWDPPFGGETAAYQWPQELKMSRPLRAVAFLSVAAFAFGLARPVAFLQRATATLQRTAATAWLLGGLATVWVLDLLISTGTRADVLLRAEANRTGYTYDRVWTTIQSTRPEVIAGGVAFAALLVGALLVGQGARRGWAERRPGAWLAALGARVAPTPVALGVVAALAVAQLVSGVLVWTTLQPSGVGGALVAGLSSAAFWLPVGVAALAAVACWWAGRRATPTEHAEAATGVEPGLREGAAAALRGGARLAVATPLLVALGGLGVGASQAAGTWTYGYLAATWGLAVALVLVVGGRARAQRAVWGLAAVGTAVVVAGSLWAVLAARVLPLAPEGARYVARVVVAAPDVAALWLLMALALVNHVARRSAVADLLRYTGLELAGLIEKPRVATLLPVFAALVMTTGYAFGLLPELGLHFSQKHLLERTGVDAQDPKAALDSAGLPRVFKYAPGGRNAIASNFYTQAMPTLSDRDAVRDLLAGVDMATRVSDFGPEARSLDLAVPGWDPSNDADHDGKRDAPAYFGIAAQVSGGDAKQGRRVVVEPAPDGSQPGWKADQWKGATLLSHRGQRVTVTGNDSDSLAVDADPALTQGDPKNGSFRLLLPGAKGRATSSAMTPVQRFVVVPKDEFSTLNFHFRRAHKGRHIPVVDARSSRLVLTATHLGPDQPDDSWLKAHVFDKARYAKEKGITPVDVNFDDKLFLIGYRLKSQTVRRAKKYELEVFFEVRRGLASSYMIFMHPHPLHRDLWPHAIHPQTKREAKRCTGCFQTNHWAQGDIVRVPIVQEVPLGTTAGAHDVILGLFNPLNDKRLIIKSGKGPGVHLHNDNRVTLTRITVR